MSRYLADGRHGFGPQASQLSSLEVMMRCDCSFVKAVWVIPYSTCCRGRPVALADEWADPSAEVA